jgi:hypothetical protein
MKIVPCLIVLIIVFIIGAVVIQFSGLKRPIKKFLNTFKPVLVAPSRLEGNSILFLHHSTGNKVWNGGVKKWLNEYNHRNKTNYEIVEQIFPKSSPYGWNNYPFDYWNIWVNHQGDKPYMREPTLEMICAQYTVIIFKHCFPVCKILEDVDKPDVTSKEKRVENYKMQYEALKTKIQQFPNKKFVVWTGATLVRGATNKTEAARAQAFFEWVKNEWDEPGDNIFLWDFHALETDGGLYMKDEYAVNSGDSHPNTAFCNRVAPLLAQRIVDVIEGMGDNTSLTGER